MKIAVHTPFEPSATIAEAEIFARLAIAVERLGWTCMRSANTRAIEAFAPDVVLAEHFRIPKLTAFPTLGLMWNPPSSMGEQDEFFKNAISYDGWLFSDEATRRFHLDLAAPLCTRHVLGRWFPSCQETALSTGPRSGIAYLATRWDNDRHGELVAELADRCDLHYYAPRKGTQALDKRGPDLLPFDGTAVIAELGRHSASLCLHSDAHRRNGTPSARVFEAAAAGAIIISDENAFVRNTFGDAALYLNVEAKAAHVADSVASHLAWLASHPDDTARMRAAAHRIFVEHFSFEVLLRQLPGLIEEIRCAWRPLERCAGQSVAFIVRTGERDLSFLDRALGSLERQTHANIHAIVVAYRNADAVRRWVELRRPELAAVAVVESNDSGMRSTSLWSGLGNVKADFFGVLDDDDTIMPDHVAACLGALDAHPEMDVAFGGSVVVNEDAQAQESRSVAYFRRFDADQFCSGNFITSNAWLARASVLQQTGDDPMLATNEDYYLLLRCLHGTNFIPTWRMTSEHYRRSNDPTVSAVLGDEVGSQSMERIRRRTYFGVFPQRPPAQVTLDPQDRPMARILSLHFLLKGLANDLGEVRKIPRLARKLPGIIREHGFQGLWRRIIAHARAIEDGKLRTAARNRTPGS
jgi:hypothetical protein